MSTRGIVAVVDNNSWSGFEIQADAYPEWAGVEVLRLLREHGLDEFCRRTREARLFAKMTVRATPTSHSGRGDLEWAYLVDPIGRKLRVFKEGAVISAHAPKLTGKWGEVAVHDLADDGGCQPPSMNVKLPVPWPLLPVVDTWELDDPKQTDAYATARLENRRKIERDCTAAGLEVAFFIQQLESAFADAFGVATTRAFIAMEWTSDSFYWSVQLAGIEVRYPATTWCRTGAVQGDAIEVFVEPDRSVEIDVSYEAIAERASVRAGLREILVSALPRTGWLFWFFDLVRARAVPDLRGEALERMALPPSLADDWDAFTHPDGRVWSIRRSKTGYQLRLGDPTDDPIFKQRTAST
jgi:hypothetical protein